MLKSALIAAISLFVYSSLAANPARADDPPTTDASPTPGVKTYSNTKESEVVGDKSGKGYQGFAGLGLGYGILNSSTELSKKGLLLEGRLTGSYYTDKAAYDLGLGWLYSSMSSGQQPAGSAVSRVQVITQVGVLELSPRYRFDEHWELGPIGQVLYGTDASFGEDSTQASAHVFLGVKGMYTMLSDDVSYRFGAQILTSVTIQNRHVWLPSGVFEIGIPLSRNKTIIREKETVRVETVVIKEGSTFAFDDEVVHFEVDKSTMYPESRVFFSELGRFLAANPTIWERVTIDGHTDDTGDRQHNLLLSQDRAKSVASTLIAAGVPTDRVETHGYGQDKPVDPAPNGIARARNRRVELSFGQGANAKLLHDEIKKIKLRTITPRTCQGANCK